MANLLLVEDDKMISRALALGLVSSGFSVTPAFNVQEASEFIKSRSFDIAIVDLNLPDGSGLDVVKCLNEIQMPEVVIVLTARQDEDSALHSFSLGVTDFVRKPIGPKELIHRLKKFKNLEPAQDMFTEHAGFVLYPDKQQVLFRGQALEMSRREFEIFHLLIRNSGHPVSRETMLTKIAAGDSIFERTIDSHISRIRSRLRKTQASHVEIKSVWGEGYIFNRLSASAVLKDL